MIKKLILIPLIVLSVLFVSQATAVPISQIHINQNKILSNAPGLKSQVLQTAIKGYNWASAHGKVNKANILTVIDFDMPSFAKRIWVLNLKSSKMLLNTYTTHGKGSGLVYAKHFSNHFNTDATSLGVYKTLNAYHGKHGLSLRVQGLEKGINNNALRRTVVVHPAWYATPSFVHKYHRTGRSLGCFAIDPAISKRFVNLVKGGTIIFAYSKQILNDPILL